MDVRNEQKRDLEDNSRVSSLRCWKGRMYLPEKGSLWGKWS